MYSTWWLWQTPRESAVHRCGLHSWHWREEDLWPCCVCGSSFSVSEKPNSSGHGSQRQTSGEGKIFLFLIIWNILSYLVICRKKSLFCWVWFKSWKKKNVMIPAGSKLTNVAVFKKIKNKCETHTLFLINRTTKGRTRKHANIPQAFSL